MEFGRDARGKTRVEMGSEVREKETVCVRWGGDLGNEDYGRRGRYDMGSGGGTEIL